MSKYISYNEKTGDYTVNIKQTLKSSGSIAYLTAEGHDLKRLLKTACIKIFNDKGEVVNRMPVIGHQVRRIMSTLLDECMIDQMMDDFSA